MDKQYFIYMTTNNINGMKYIGKHKGFLNDKYLGSGTVLKYAIKKYGKENFSREILEINQTEEENCIREKYYITLYDAVNNPLFYNIHEGGNGGNTTAGYTPEQKRNLKEKLSRLNSGKNNGMYGKHHSQQTKEYLSFWATYQRDNSVYRTPEFREKMSKITSGTNNGMYGKHHSELSKQKMSEKALKRDYSGTKNPMYGKKGEQAINGKAIGAFDKNNILKHSFQTKQLALQFLNLKGHIGLDKALLNGNEYKGYFWKYL